MTPPEHERRAPPSEQDLKIQRSLTVCWKDGVAAQVMIGIFDNYLTPFALFLGATNQHIGYLTAIPNLVASIFQLMAVKAVQWAGSRKTWVVWGAALQAVMIIPIALLPFISTNSTITLLMVATTFHKTLGNLVAPAWGSMVSEYLPPKRRGHYFGWRSRVLGITGLVNLIIWGLFLHYWESISSIAVGFMCLFTGAFVARVISVYLLTQMTELPELKSKESEFTFWMFIRRFRESNFVRFVFYVSGITFTTHLSAPYFSVHMLRDLNFDYRSYMMVMVMSLISSLIAFPIWGKHADVVGNARILKFTGWLTPIIPWLWLISNKLPWLMMVEFFAGFVWGGFNLCAANYILDAVTPSKRVRCLGYFNLINGVALFAGSCLGGFISDRLPPTFGFSLLSLIALSGVGRLIVNILLARHFTEVRTETKHIPSVELFFSVVGIRPLLGRGLDLPGLATDVHYGDRPKHKQD